MLKQIISSGQTGAERAALDAALAAKLPVGGYCRRGRLAQDGHLDVRYPLIELDDPDTSVAIQNAANSDGSLICYQGQPHAELAEAICFCLAESLPCLLIDLELVNHEKAAGALEGFIEAHGIKKLHVIGPNEQDCCQSYDYMATLIGRLLKQYCQ